jgi:hypothetical protein
MLNLAALAAIQTLAAAVVGGGWEVDAIDRYCDPPGLLLVQKRADRKDSAAEEGWPAHEANLLGRSGSTAPLTEDGYQFVLGQKSNEEMKYFVKRLLSSMDLLLVDEDKLNAMVPFYSGVAAGHDFDSLRMELLVAKWAIGGTGWSSPLTDEGYTKVFTSGAIAPRRAFSRRILYEHGDTVFCCDEALDALLSRDDWHSKHFDSLKTQIDSLARLVELARKHAEASPGMTAPLSETGYQFVTLPRSNVEMKHFIRRLAEFKGLAILDEAKLSGLVPYYSGVTSIQDFNSLVGELSTAAWVRKANETR